MSDIVAAQSSPARLRYGGVPVPFTVAWTGEERTFIAICPHARKPAICQEIAPGSGKPTFGAPHFVRQRQAIIDGLCDICGLSLRNRTKVSLSHAKLRANGADGAAILQVEPLLHKECAALSLRHCPSLKRDIRNGTLFVRQVTKERVQVAVSDPSFIHVYVPGFNAKPSDRILAHAKVELLSWRDRNEEWLQP
jgi:hypothetical protein